MWTFLADNAIAVFLFLTVIIGAIAITLVAWKVPHPASYFREQLLGEQDENRH